MQRVGGGLGREELRAAFEKNPERRRLQDLVARA
jgi:hypothetical protein